MPCCSNAVSAAFRIGCTGYCPGDNVVYTIDSFQTVFFFEKNLTILTVCDILLLLLGFSQWHNAGMATSVLTLLLVIALGLIDSSTPELDVRFAHERYIAEQCREMYSKGEINNPHIIDRCREASRYQ